MFRDSKKNSPPLVFFNECVMRIGTFAPDFPNGKKIVGKVVQVLNLQKFGNQKTSSFGLIFEHLFLIALLFLTFVFSFNFLIEN